MLSINFSAFETSIFLEFDDSGFPLFRHVFLAVPNTFNWIGIEELRLILTLNFEVKKIPFAFYSSRK